MKIRTSRFAAALAGLAAITLVSGSALAGPSISGNEPLYVVAKKAGSFNTLLAAVDAAGLKQTLLQNGQLTVFAPTDEAFAKLPPGTVEALLADPAALRNILLYHVVLQEVPSSVAIGLVGQQVEMANGDMATINAGGMGVGIQINQADIVDVDIYGRNGVIHVIDQVILPPTN
jgi:uncharacterized surface protein with fasciclin (FAS1) repeats